jgi:heme/copper-type cytochrome/quinol oxidase subunit 4
MKQRHWQDGLMLAFGIWLFLSPFWMTGYGGFASLAAWHSYVFGVLVAGFAWSALAEPRPWKEWVQLALGIWLVVAPFVLVFYQTEPGAAWNHIILGLLIGVNALWALAAQRATELRT